MAFHGRLEEQSTTHCEILCNNAPQGQTPNSQSNGATEDVR